MSYFTHINAPNAARVLESKREMGLVSVGFDQLTGCATREKLW